MSAHVSDDRRIITQGMTGVEFIHALLHLSITPMYRLPRGWKLALAFKLEDFKDEVDLLEYYKVEFELLVNRLSLFLAQVQGLTTTGL